MPRPRSILAILGLLLAPLSPPASRAQTVPVGVAAVNITPEYPIRLQGYNVRKEESKGVEQRLWAKALAIGSDEQGPCLLVTLDNLGVPDALVTDVLGRLKDAGITRERFAVGASHTHSAPCLTGVAPNIFGSKLPDDQQKRIDQYTRELGDNLVKVCRDALKARKPSSLSWARGRVGFAMNRRTAGGPVDHDMPMLRVTDEEGNIRAILVDYACHCTTLDPAVNKMSGDWSGYAQEEIQHDHPGAIALVLIGCGADANPRDRTGTEVARRHGRAIADEVNRLLENPLKPLKAPPIARFKRIVVPFDTLPTRPELEAKVKAGGPIGYNAETQLAKLDRGEKLQEALDYPIQTWQFGDDLCMVFLAGEVVVDYAIRLKSELDASRLWIAAYANDLPCYIPSERILREGGYEGGGAMVYYGRPTRLKPGIEDQIIGTVRELVPPEFQAPAKAENQPR